MKAQSIGTMAACCGILLIQSAVADTSATADSAVVLERADDGGGGPAFELAVDFCSRQLTYGLVDNRDPIFTVEALAEWHGFTFEAAMIFDTTKWGRKHGGYGNRQGTYQELAFGPGYIYALSPEDVRLLPTTVELFINYIYEYHPPVRKDRGEENPDTQFVNIGMALPDLWLTPAVSAEFDIDNEAGAIYLAAEVGHSFTLIEGRDGCGGDPLVCSVGCGVGFGNAKRNRYDADFDTCAFKDVWVSAALEWQITDHLLLAPYAAVYEQIHGRLRSSARRYMDDPGAGVYETHASTQLIGGVRLVAMF